MKGKITITDNGTVTVPSEIRMTIAEIADLFGVYVSAVNANIRAVVKSGVIRPDTRHRATVSGNTILPELYSLEMIIALAFRINSHKAETFRKWIMKKVVVKATDSYIPVIVQCGNNLLLC